MIHRKLELYLHNLLKLGTEFKGIHYHILYSFLNISNILPQKNSQKGLCPLLYEEKVIREEIL